MRSTWGLSHVKLTEQRFESETGRPRDAHQARAGRAAAAGQRSLCQGSRQSPTITARTVESHIDRICLKTRTRNRTHMVAQALKQGLLAAVA